MQVFLLYNEWLAFIYLIVESGMTMKVRIGFVSCSLSAKVQHFLWLCMNNAIPTNKIRWILLQRRKFSSRYGVLITHIFSASQPGKHRYKQCLNDLLVTCF
uniref:Uncharacterized protein n=1 Tax=Medicago truncatula TaxID=3880 RepID=A2Q360_MEDTR|nr:hypothetical protein MtrDRAFT_AC154867g20v2 [Medicago truncatula]